MNPPENKKQGNDPESEPVTGDLFPPDPSPETGARIASLLFAKAGALTPVAPQEPASGEAVAPEVSVVLPAAAPDQPYRPMVIAPVVVNHPAAVQAPETAPQSVKPRRFAWGTGLAGFGLGVLAAGLAGFFWMEHGPYQKRLQEQASRFESDAQKLQSDLETAQIEITHLKTGSRKLSTLLAAFRADWDRPVDKPQFLKTPDGVLIYWEDSLIWRRYHLYQGRGTQALTRVNSRPQKKNFVYLSHPLPGEWRFAVSALTQEGRETPMSESLVLKLP